MTDDLKKTDWSRVDRSGPGRNLPEVIPTDPEVLAPTPSQTVGGVLQRLKEGKIVRKAALQELEAITTARLDVLTQSASRGRESQEDRVYRPLPTDSLRSLTFSFQEVVAGAWYPQRSHSPGNTEEVE